MDRLAVSTVGVLASCAALWWAVVGWDGGIKRVNEQDEAAWRVYVLENVPTFSIGSFLELRC